MSTDIDDFFARVREVGLESVRPEMFSDNVVTVSYQPSRYTWVKDDWHEKQYKKRKKINYI